MRSGLGRLAAAMIFLIAGGRAVCQPSLPEDRNWDPRFGLPNVAHDVYALGLDDAGDLFAGGAFPGNVSALGGGDANYIAEWAGREWLPLGSLLTNGVSGAVRAIAVSGTNVYVGGEFGGVNAIGIGEYGVNFVARWDGNQWARLGAGATFGVEGQVYALAVQNGLLYVGGRFISAGGVPATNIARWDGQQWTALGSGLGDPQTDRVTTIAVADDGTVYAGGSFTVAGSTTVNRIARWDGSTWEPLHGGVDNTVNAIAIDGGAVYVGGAFGQAGGAPASHLARWDGTGWSEVGGGVSGGDVDALALDGSTLYVGGDFTAANGVPAAGLATWSGLLWSGIGGGVNGGITVATPAVYAIQVRQGLVYVGGNFDSAGESYAPRTAVWDGQRWSALNHALGGGENLWPSAVAVSGTNVYVGGSFSAAGGHLVNNLARWDGADWSPLGQGTNNGVNGRVDTIAPTPDGAVYVGGEFTAAAGVSANRIARWNGAGWSALGAGIQPAQNLGVMAVRSAVVASNGTLFVGGNFTVAGEAAATNIAAWDGSRWSALAAGLDGTVLTLAVDGNTLYAGGAFVYAGNLAVNGVARWDGISWHPVGGGVSYPGYQASVWALTVVGSNLYVGGAFQQAGGGTANNLARWDGQNWSPFGGGTDFKVNALQVIDGQLFAGGEFATIGGQAINALARWDGTNWAGLGRGLAGTLPSGGGSSPRVLQMAASATDLYVVGSFTLAGGKPSTAFASWSLNHNPPTITITNPPDGTTFAFGDRVFVAVTAASADSSITQVDFYANDNLLGGVTNAPYNLTWRPASGGAYALVAQAIDGFGVAANSSPVTIQVLPPTNDIPPTVNLTSPAAGSVFVAGTSITVTASANDADGSVARVDFYQGTTLLGSASATPYAFTWTNVPASRYTLTAVATDNQGATALSAPVAITVSTMDIPPSITFITPQDNEVFMLPTNIVLAANASDSDGQIVKVEFFTNGVLLASLPASSQYLVNWTDATPGVYTVTARATDDGGQTATAAVRIVASRLIPSQLVYTNDFEGAVGPEWSDRQTDVTPVNGRRFLGQFGVQTVTLTLTNLPMHNTVTVGFDLLLIQSWDGNDPTVGPDIWDLRVAGGPTLLHTTFGTHNLINNQVTNRTQSFPGTYPGAYYPVLTGAREVNTLGYLWKWPGPMDAVYHLVYTFNHVGSELQLYFIGAMHGFPDEFWGLDNVHVTVGNVDSNTPPRFVLQPRSQITMAGDTIALTTQAASPDPVQYHWQFNGTGLPGATNAYLALTNLDTTRAGPYTVIAANPSGSVTSQVSQVVVVEAPRRGQVVTEGTNVVFAAAVAGADVVRYRWKRNDREIVGATDATLTLPNVTAAQTGNYSVEVQTPVGTLRAPPVKLTIDTPVNQPVYATDFRDLLVGPEWSTSQRASTPRDRRSVLGFFANDAVTLTLTNLPPHTEVNLALDLLAVLTLDGNAAPPGGPDIWRVEVNGLQNSLFQTTFSSWHGGVQAYPGGYPGSNYPGRAGAAEIGTLGFQQWYGSVVDYPSGMNNLDAVYNVNLQFQHTNSTLRVTFAGANMEGLWNEGWAIGNVVVSVAQVPPNSAPELTQAPVSQFARAGDPVVFQAGATVESPDGYQWSFDGHDLPGKTNAYLVLPSVDGNQAGQYWVTITNAYGAIGRPVHLSVLTRDPDGESVNTGDPAIFIAAAAPLDVRYQWRVDGVDLPGQTKTNLVLENVTATSSGTYQVLVSDGYSSLLSVAAGLTVAPGGQPGSVEWVFPEGSSFWSTPAVAPDGTVYAGATSGNLYALSSPYGDIRWQRNLGGPIYSSPVVGADGTIYVVAGQTLYAISRLGIIRWQAGRFADGRPTTLPALGPNGTIYLTSGLDNSGSARLLQAINSDGTFRWTYTASGTTPASPVVGADGTIYFAVNNPYETVALRTNGPVEWVASANNPFNASPAIGSDGTLYSCAANGEVFALNPINGARKWTLDTKDFDLMMSSPVVGPDNVVYVGSDKGNLFAIAPDGTLLWTFSAGAPIRATPAISSSGSIYFTAYNGKLYCLNPAGVEEWERVVSRPIPYLLENWFQGSPAIAPDGMVYVATHDGRLWRIRGDTGPAPSSWPQFHGNALHSGSLAYDPSDTSGITALTLSNNRTLAFRVLTAPKRFVDIYVSPDLQDWTWLTNLYSATGAVQFNLPVEPGRAVQFFRAQVP